MLIRSWLKSPCLCSISLYGDTTSAPLCSNCDRANWTLSCPPNNNWRKNFTKIVHQDHLVSEPAGSNYLRMFIPILLLSIFQLGSFALAQEQYLIPPLTGGIMLTTKLDLQALCSQNWLKPHQDSTCPYAFWVGVVEDRSVLMGLPGGSYGPTGSCRPLLV